MSGWTRFWVAFAFAGLWRAAGFGWWSILLTIGLTVGVNFVGSFMTELGAEVKRQRAEREQAS